jgi:hypothetical protein
MDETKHALIVDLNHWRKRDLKPLVDAGVDGFIFRIGGPAQWVDGNYRYTEDVTWRSYMEQADKLGIPRDRIGGYIVHNPFEDWRLANDVHIDLLNQWTGGGFMPGYLILDHEINYTWRGSNKIIATPYNIVSSMAAVMDKMYKTFRRPVMLYTARWFIDSNGPAEHVTRLDNENGQSKRWAMWYAWYLNQYTNKTYTNARQAITDLPNPTGDQVAKLLQCGSYSLWDLWQFTSCLKIGADTTGVDANVTRLPADDYWRSVGAKVGGTPPPDEPPPPPPPPPGDIAKLYEQFDALAARVAELERWRKS